MSEEGGIEGGLGVRRRRFLQVVVERHHVGIDAGKEIFAAEGGVGGGREGRERVAEIRLGKVELVGRGHAGKRDQHLHRVVRRRRHLAERFLRGGKTLRRQRSARKR